MLLGSSCPCLAYLICPGWDLVESRSGVSARRTRLPGGKPRQIRRVSYNPTFQTIGSSTRERVAVNRRQQLNRRATQSGCLAQLESNCGAPPEKTLRPSSQAFPARSPRTPQAVALIEGWQYFPWLVGRKALGHRFSRTERYWFCFRSCAGWPMLGYRAG